jgi:sugar phosphate isomerase/epimerase
LSCVEYASERGVAILMEIHDDWSNTAALWAVIATVDHPSLKCLWDVMHPQ